MKSCSYKYELYKNINYQYNNINNDQYNNINKIYQYIKSISFECSNCFSNQLIKNDFILIGYCNGHCHKNSAINSNSICANLTDNDELTFVCSNKNCSKISFNNLDGKPKYNTAQLNKKDLDVLDILKQKEQDILFSLLEEYFFALELKLNSCATLLARKLLIHFAFELGCTEKNKDFVFYVKYIKNDGTLGKNWNSSLDKVRLIGNSENHQLKIATDEELETVKVIMEQLINSHFLPEL